ncbi:MAG: ABC transporter permease [Planctomycetes bacterium]|nr:ABC transporter permease [Planctomycetota bacterium]
MIGDLGRTIRLGLKSLLLHKLRSSLTTAGILFGVASVIAMLAVGEGASQDALMRFRDMGVTNVLIRSKKPEETQQSSSSSGMSILGYGLFYKEADRIADALPSATVVRVREVQRGLMRSENWVSSIVIGTEPAFLPVTNMQIAEGRWLTDLDLSRQANVCVLGASLARALFPLENPIDQTVLAGTEDRFRIIGVLEYQGRAAGASGTTYDECAFVPMTSSRRRFGDTVRNLSTNRFEAVELHEIKVRLETSEEVESAAAVLRDMLLPKSDPAIGGMAPHVKAGDVEITVPLELLKQEEASKRMFNIVLAVIASISLLVGGIGIMNVMLATVTERTREIGIRRALGAKKKHIIQQFLVEAGVLSALGGLVGVGLGLLIPDLITRFFDQRTDVLPQHVLLAFGISAAVGVVFGIYPAWRAANMDPVEALRHE